MGVIGQAFIEVIPDSTKFATKLSGDLKEGIDKAEGGATSSFGKIADLGQKAFLGLGTAAIGFGAIAVAEALKGQESQALLKNAIDNSGGSFEELEPKIDKVTQGMATFGFTNDEAEGALARLVTITGDSTKSMDLLKTATDLAAARHLDLTTAANLVGRAAEGNITPLKKMGIQVQDTGSQAGNAEAAIKALNDRFGGAAQAQADTYAGKLKAFKAEVSNLEEKIGLALLPTLANLGGILGGGIGFFEKNTVAAGALATVIGGPLAVAMGAYIIKEGILLATKVADFFETAAISALYAKDALVAAGTAIYGALGPVGLAITAVTALAIALDHTDESAKKAGEAYGNAYVSSVKGAGTESETLKGKIAQLTAEQDKLILSGADWISITDKGNSAWAGVRTQVAATSKEYQNNQAQIKVLQKAVDDNTASVKATDDAHKELVVTQEKAGTATSDLATQFGTTTDVVDGLATKLKIDLSKATEEQITQLGQASDKLKFTSQNTEDYSGAIDVLSSKTEDASAKTKAFKTALDLLIGSNVDADKAVVTFYGTIDTLGEKLKAGGANLDFHTQKGRDNISAIDDTVTAIGNHIEAMKKQGAKADDIAKAFDGDTTALRNQLTQAGFTTTQIQNLIDRYNLVPSTINTLVQADFSSVYAEAANVDQAFKNLFSGIVAKGKGGTLRTFDVGGYVDAPVGAAVPAIVHGGEYVLRADQVRAGIGGGVTIAAGAVQVNQTLGAGTSPEVARMAAAAAREEVISALEEVLGHHTALNPAGGPG